MITCEKMIESFVGELGLLRPVYQDGGGDMTQVGLTSGESWIDPRPVSTVIKLVARHFGVDLTAVRERYGDILGRRLYVPLPFAPHLILVPLKMRVPRVAKDGTTGYVASRLVERVLPGAEANRCYLQVHKIGRLECLQSGAFARQQLRNARIVETFYRELMSGYPRTSLPASIK
jgi:hypothetical protein